MTELKNLDKSTYDFAIIGSNFTAFSLAFLLERRFNKRVAILDASSNYGGVNAPLDHAGERLEDDFLFQEDNEGLKRFLSDLEEHLSETLIGTLVENEPQTIDSGSLIPFVGYGERKFKSIEHLESFVKKEHFQLLQTPGQLIDALKSQFLGDLYFLAEPTSLEVNEESQNIDFAWVNGAKKLKADHFLFCLPPKQLEKLLPQDHLQTRAFQKIMKARTYSRVRLHLRHSEAFTDSQNFHIMYGNKDDFEPCVGQTWTKNEKVYSHWLTLCPSELAEDADHLGACLRFIKKQIKRVYPESLETIDVEKIVVDLDEVGFMEWDAKSLLGKLPHIDNLWISHQQLYKDSGFSASCRAAAGTLAQLEDVLNLHSKPNYTVASVEPQQSL